MEIALFVAFAVFGGITGPMLRDVVAPPRRSIITVPSVDEFGTPRPAQVPLLALVGPSGRATAEHLANVALGWPGPARACAVYWSGDTASSALLVRQAPLAAATPAPPPVRVVVHFDPGDPPIPNGLSVSQCALLTERPLDWGEFLPASPSFSSSYHPFDLQGTAVDATTWARWSLADYLLVAPEAWLPALRPLIRLREAQGHHVVPISIEAVAGRHGGEQITAAALADFVSALHAHTTGKLHYVFLVGDATADDAATRIGEAPEWVVPTGYRPKLDYWTGATDTEPPFPTDDVFAHPTPEASLAVGRFPAHEVSEVAGFVNKLVAYETAPAEGAWRRRVVVFTGPARYGVVADTLIQSTAQHVLDNVLPYDYDLRFTFGFPENPYAVAPQALGDKLVSDLDGGALIAAYVGHGLGSSFDHIQFRGEFYPIGSLADMQRLDIAGGAPFFLSLTCLTGAFDRSTDSLAEAFVRNPHGGVAAFAASRQVHPYANGLFAQAIAQAFLIDHPATIGDGLLTVKRLAPTYRQRLLELAYGFDVDALLAEHSGLYNLFGDPATRLRYALPAAVTVTPDSVTPDSVTVGAAQPLSVTVITPGIRSGRVTLTLETQRSVVRAKVRPWSELAALPLDELRAAMANNYEQVMDKVVLTMPLALDAGRATASVPVPAVAGKYYVKVLVEGQGETAVGSAKVVVTAGVTAPK